MDRDEADRLMRLAAARRLASTGEALRIREAAGLTRAEVARVVGVDRATVSRWEDGSRRPTGDAALRFAELLGALDRDSRQGVGA